MIRRAGVEKVHRPLPQEKTPRFRTGLSKLTAMGFQRLAVSRDV
jgi:hypothetical protein